MSQSENPLTRMAVHAHPDDEATSGGASLVRYRAEGVQTVVVTCTDGAEGEIAEQGVAAGKPARERGRRRMKPNVSAEVEFTHAPLYLGLERPVADHLDAQVVVSRGQAVDDLDHQQWILLLGQAAGE